MNEKASRHKAYRRQSNQGVVGDAVAAAPWWLCRRRDGSLHRDGGEGAGELLVNNLDNSRGCTGLPLGRWFGYSAEGVWLVWRTRIGNGNRRRMRGGSNWLRS